LWEKAYKTACKKECNDDTRAAAKFILSRNIVCGNALTLLCVDEDGLELNVPIVFSEWSFPRNDAFIYRKDYSFASLLSDPAPSSEQLDMFDDTDPNGEGEFIEEYKCHYRRLGDNE